MDIKKELKFLIKEDLVDAIILFGSRARGDFNKRSDWDICLVIGNRNIEKVLREIWKNWRWKNVDIEIFELLPLELKIKVINEGKIIWSKIPKSELSYYFYKFRKLWEDQAIHRIKAF